MTQMPPLPQGSADELPIDRSLRLYLNGDVEGALRTAAGLVKSHLDAPLPLLVTGKALSELGQKAQGIAALELAADRAVSSGHLPLAVAAFSELRKLGVDTTTRVQVAAAAYAKGSPRIKAGPVPPSIGSRQEQASLPAALSGAALVAEVLQILDYAKASLEADRSRPAPPLSPQRLFSSLSAAAGAAMMRGFSTRVVPKGAVLIEEGTTGAEAFLLARGEVEVSRKSGPAGPVLLARLGAGALFGEMALLARAPRAATVKAAMSSIVLVMDEAALSEIARDAPEVAAAFAAFCRRRMVENLLRTSPILRALKEAERLALMESFVTKSYEKGEKIIAQGGSSQGLHLVASGQVVVQRADGDGIVVIARLGVGEVFGEVAMVLRRPANADVIADQPTITVHLPQDGFMGLVREHPTVLSQLYELAVKRDEETSSIVAQEATDADDFII